MKTIQYLTSDTLPLFAAANARQRRQEARPLEYPARWIRKHHPGLSPALAALVADLHFGSAR